MRYPLRLKWATAAAVFFFIAALVVVSLIFWGQGSLVPTIGSDAAWVAYKLDREAIELRSQLLRSEHGPPQALDELQLSFDLLYSRTNLLRDGQIAELIRSIPTVQGLIEPILDQVEALDEDIRSLNSLDAAAVERLQARFQSLGNSTQRLVMAINEHFAQTKTAARETMFQLYTALLALIVLMSLATVSVVRLLFQEARANDASRRTLEVLSRELEVTAHRAESASRAKSDFLAVVSHEIRTPLNGVIGMSALLMERQRDAQSRHYALTIHESAEILLSLINDILDFSKIEAGRLDLEVEAFDLERCIDSVVQLLAPRVEGLPVKLEWRIEPGVAAQLIGDPGRLRQVLLNLLSNALKFTTVGEVVLSVAAGEAGQVRFTVSDTGCGIPESRQPTLFEPFRQGDASTARHYGGTGLGLAICKRLVNAMGGTIGFVSQQDQGSRFWFEVPLSRAEGVVVQAPSQIPFPTLGETPFHGRVLVVEDNAVNRRVAIALLERFGLTIDVAENGRLAVSRALAGDYDLIFMDMQMPELDGIEATRAIRAAGGALAEVPIVAMTAGVLDGARERAIAAGMTDYLTKPILPGQLERMLSRFLAGTPATRQQQATTATGPSGSDEALIDSGVLAEIESALGAKMIDELVQLYRQQVPERLAELDAEVGGDGVALAEQAHRLKGESSGLGLNRVATLATALERDAIHLDVAGRRLRVTAIEAALDDTLEALERLDATT
ncbi:ATP-binding protein [Halomonas sp. HP20-15]|uniref:ATP-binding protein n=1 Tax=Halomonas sp. HP20-15 TaxID=3085901 RepID=UPI002981736C|nr:ATP-binding protein [Halomonas sp. HP20-15]MDW5377877.1 ATP-binding protein [Halomonas sp. HP20-15]